MKQVLCPWMGRVALHARVEPRPSTLRLASDRQHFEAVDEWPRQTVIRPELRHRVSGQARVPEP